MIDRKVDPDNDNVGKLVELVGPREELPETTKARLSNVFRDELKKSRNAHELRKRRQYLSIAAVLTVAAMIGWLYPTQSTKLPTAQVAVVKGEVNWANDLSSGVLEQGNQIDIGDIISTSARGRLNINLHNSPTSVRLDVNTKVRFSATAELILESGRLYVDSGSILNEHTEQPLRVLVNGIKINHVGTQYLVDYQKGEFSVAVREGTVQVAVNDTVKEAHGTNDIAQQLSIDINGNIDSKQILRNNHQWSWINQVSPAFYTDQRRYIDFLQWYSRDTGRKLQFEHSSDQIIAREEIIIGNYPTDVADDALDDVMRTSEQLRISVLSDEMVLIGKK